MQQMTQQASSMNLAMQDLAMQQMTQQASSMNLAMQDLAMQQMTQQMSSMNMSAIAQPQPNQQVQSMNSMENMTIVPLQNGSNIEANIEANGHILNRKSTAVPNLPDEIDDGDTTDGTDTDDERDMYANDDYNSPGNDEMKQNVETQGGQTQRNIEMQQFSMAPFE
eukprot:302493_1